MDHHIDRDRFTCILFVFSTAVNVRGLDGAASGSLPLPAVFTAPIRPDVVQLVHSEYLDIELI